MSMIADIIVLALVIAYGVFVISYLYSRKQQGLSCVGCAGNTRTGGCAGHCSGCSGCSGCNGMHK